MKVSLNNMHSPCTMCFQKGINYDVNSKHCKSCEYNVAVTLLKRILKEELYCSTCKKSINLGGGYWGCSIEPDNSSEYCQKGKNLVIDWEVVCHEYGVEFEEEI